MHGACLDASSVRIPALRVEIALQDESGRYRVPHLPTSRSPLIRGQQRLLCFSRGQALVPELDLDFELTAQC